MQSGSQLLRSFRAIILLSAISVAFMALVTLTIHYGLESSRQSAENDELKGQVRGLVTRLAEVEGLLKDVGNERQAVESVTLKTLGTVLDTTKLDAQKHGQLYVASLSAEARKNVALKAADAGPPMSAASMAALMERSAEVRIQARELVSSMKETTRLLSLRGDVLAAIPSRLPAKGWISSDYGVRESPFHTGERMHHGIDVAADEGTPVYATADGIVLFAGTFGGYGKFVRISHGFGITTRYAHNAELMVKTGQKVRRGDQISVIGSTGRSTGPHVHYEIRVYGEPVDPSRYVFDGVAADAPPALAQSSTHDIDARPMGGEADVATNDSLEMRAERFILPELLGRTTATNIIVLIAFSLIMALATAFLRLPADPVPARMYRGAYVSPREQTYDMGGWAGSQASDEDE